MCRMKRKGFTLAELLVVVAIIGVLVAVAILLFQSQLEKARAATCLANRRSMKSELSAKLITEASAFQEDYFYTVDATGDEAQFKCPDKGEIKYILKDGKIEVFCSVHDETTDVWTNEKMNQIMNALKTWMDGLHNIDSTATDGNDAMLNEILQTLKDNGLDLKALGAESWHITNSGENRMIEWTTQDISQMEPGTPIIVMRYKPNLDGGTYTVWSTTVEVGANGYNVISTKNPVQITTNKDDKTDITAIKEVYNNQNLDKPMP